MKVIYMKPWAARHLIDIPVDDMLIRRRTLDEGNKDSVKRMQETERQIDVVGRLARAAQPQADDRFGELPLPEDNLLTRNGSDDLARQMEHEAEMAKNAE